MEKIGASPINKGVSGSMAGSDDRWTMSEQILFREEKEEEEDGRLLDIAMAYREDAVPFVLYRRNMRKECHARAHLFQS